MNATVRLCVILGAVWLWSCDAHAYHLRALENSFNGTNSTTAPFIHWTRDRELNGIASADILSHGQEGFVRGSVSLLRIYAGQTSIASTPNTFIAQLEENVQPLTPTPQGAIIRLTMFIECSGIAFRTPPPSGNTGSAFIDVDARLGVYGARMIGLSHHGFSGDWQATTNNDANAFESTFNLQGGLIQSLTYAYKRGSGIEPNYYFAIQVSGEATAGSFNSAQALAQAHARINFMMQVSTDNGVTYTVVPWAPMNAAFLAGHRPRTSLTRFNLNNYVGIVGLPLTQHQLQAAPTPIGPWANVGPSFVITNLQPFVLIDPEPATARFYQTIKP